MGLLAFPATNQIPKYEKYLSKERWDMLIQQFKGEIFSAYGLSSHSLLEIYLQSGIISLKSW